MCGGQFKYHLSIQNWSQIHFGGFVMRTCCLPFKYSLQCFSRQAAQLVDGVNALILCKRWYFVQMYCSVYHRRFQQFISSLQTLSILLINILVDNLRYPQRFVQFIKYPLKSGSSLSKFHFLSSCHSMSQLMFWLNRPGGTT